MCDHPNKQHSLWHHQGLRYNDETIIADSTIVKSPIKHTKMSHILNDISLDQWDRNSILEQSLENDLRQWQQTYKIDKSIVQKLEQEIKTIDSQILQIATQFDICLELHRKTESKFREFHKLMKGTQFVKFSRSNCQRYDTRTIFYCPFLDSICWKSCNSKFPTSKQTIPINTIIQIHTNYAKYKSIKKNFTLPPDADSDCFLAIEAKNGIKLELLAMTQDDQILFAKALTLMKERNSSIQDQRIIEQYSMDINSIRRNLENSKQNFIHTIEKLQQTYISTTSTLLKQEQEKTLTLKKKSQNYVLQSKLKMEDLNSLTNRQNKLIEELQLDKDYLETRIEELEEYYTQRQQPSKIVPNPQLTQIYQIINKIINNNQIEESQYQYQPSDYFEETIKSLQKLEIIYQQSITSEQESKIFYNEILKEKQQMANQLQQSQLDLHESEMYINELENVNNLLQNKLQDITQILEYKENQFKIIIDDMQKMSQEMTIKSTINSVANTETKRLQTENDLLKDTIQNKIKELKLQIEKEEKVQMNLLISLITYFCYYISPDDLSSDANITLQGLYFRLCDKVEAQHILESLFQQLKNKFAFYLKNYQNEFDNIYQEKQNVLSSLKNKSFSQIGSARNILKENEYNYNSILHNQNYNFKNTQLIKKQYQKTNLLN